MNTSMASFVGTGEASDLPLRRCGSGSVAPLGAVAPRVRGFSGCGWCQSAGGTHQLLHGFFMTLFYLIHALLFLTRFSAGCGW